MKTLSFLSFFLFFSISTALADGPHFATGIKIGEVDHDSALVWVRLTEHEEPSNLGAPAAEVDPGSFRKSRRAIREMVEGVPRDKQFRSVAGAPGEVRLSHFLKVGFGEITQTPWTEVKAERDFSRQFKLENLSPNTAYAIRVEARAKGSDEVSATIEGEFKTAPAPDATEPVSFTVVTGQGFWDRDDPDKGHKIYPSMLALDPDFFIHTGDIVYYDSHPPAATSVALARHHWDRMYSFPYQVDFHRKVASYFMKDDHDTVTNDCWPKMSAGEFTWDQGIRLFVEQVPMGEKTYRTARWGKDLQIWFVEGRDYRSANDAPDDGTKTIWGEEQMRWLKDTMEASDATFRLLVSPTPIVGPDRGNKRDNHANTAFQEEGDAVREYLASLGNCFVLCGDRHWQYHTVDPATGLQEFSCGPTTDAHAGGFSEDQRSDMHQFLRIKGGFLRVVVDRNSNDRPYIQFEFFGVGGDAAHRFRQTGR